MSVGSETIFNAVRTSRIVISRTGNSLTVGQAMLRVDVVVNKHTARKCAKRGKLTTWGKARGKERYKCTDEDKTNLEAKHIDMVEAIR